MQPYAHPTGFWQDLTSPIIGLAPMDGVTDAACRFIAAKYGQPAVIFTEFTAVEGLRAGALRLLDDFYYHPIERPVVAQLFGSDPESFIQGAAIAAALGFDGVDINMGCPAKNVTQHGAGAALIRTPDIARAIIRATREGIDRYAAGETLAELGVHPDLLEPIAERQKLIEETEGKLLERRYIPVSLKTRIGYNEVAVEAWVSELLKEEPIAITLHGRTLAQGYAGFADWEAIGRAAKIIKQTPTKVLGNGDVQSLEDGLERMHAAGTDGFLIGRKSTGNPWVFDGTTTTFAERIPIAIEHARYLHGAFGDRGFARIRKHLLEYTKDFPGAKLVRMQLSQVHTLSDVERILSDPALLQ